MWYWKFYHRFEVKRKIFILVIFACTNNCIDVTEFWMVSYFEKHKMNIQLELLHLLFSAQ